MCETGRHYSGLHQYLRVVLLPSRYTASGPIGTPRIRSELLNRNIAVLTIAQAASVTGTTSLITLGGIVGRDLAPSPALATLPISMLVVGTAAATLLAAWIMSQIGRARGFVCGASIGCAGAICAVLAMIDANFLMFCAAAVLIGVANAFAQQYRFAAAESVSAASAGLAISITLAGSLLGAVLGPELAARGEFWLHGARFAGTFVAVAGCYVFSGVVLLGLRSSVVSTPSVSSHEVRPVREIARNRVFVVAVLGGAAGFGVMSFVMTAAPLAMHITDGHSLAHTAGVIQAHVLAMYAPSLVTGLLLRRFGITTVMLGGALILCLTVVAGFAGREILHYGISMVALGVGWNFLFVGGTTLLGTSHRPQERFRAQAVNDFTVFGLSAAGSLAAGAVMQLYGWNAVLWASVPVIIVTIAALAWARPRSGG